MRTRFSDKSPPSSKVARIGDGPQVSSTVVAPQPTTSPVATPGSSMPGTPFAPHLSPPPVGTSSRGPDFATPMMGRPLIIKERLGRFVFAPEVHRLGTLGTDRIIDTYLEGLAQVRVCYLPFSSSSLCPSDISPPFISSRLRLHPSACFQGPINTTGKGWILPLWRGGLQS